ILEKPTLRTSLRHVLYAEEHDNTITLSTLAKKSNRLSLVKAVAAVGGAREGQPTGAEWVRDLLQAAYLDTQPRRNFKILINPAGGPGKARGIFEKRIKPILDAARCVTDVTCTTHRGHAREIAMTLPLTYDAILLVSGDGLPHEVVNGFAQRLDARAAFERTAIVPIAAGSGNAFSVNLLGPQEGMDPVMGILNAIKGKPMKLDLASVTMQNSKETIYSFLTQTGGLMAELDLGTENLRWMGDTRFIVGFIRGLWSKTPRALKVTIRDPDNDKERLLQSFLNDPPPPHAPDAEESNEIPARMPGPKYADEPDDAEGWVTFDKPILYMQGGLLPWVGRDLIDFPLKQPCDGSLHL
ncbi:sphinganine kinase lcb4, partial [Tulasnella sp. 403]